MKGKLYIFGIGGTGTRVIKSLIMLAASGVEIEADAIVPIIVDPDFANGDVTRTIELIKNYTAIRSKLNYDDSVKNSFFGTRVDNVVSDYRLTIKDTKNKKFREFIQYSTLSKENKALASILFSEENLESDMEVGFKGNPNIGSVVLNQFTDSQDFLDFASAFRPGDRIFIISSIFGGTGASGFPLLLKNIRGLDNSLPNSDAIRKSPVGAITVLPYFAVELNEESSINSSTFIGKTKAALQYYEKNVNGDKSSLNVLYYIGDDRSKQYSNNEGGVEQQNNAHIVELAAAMSIIDFVSIPDDDIKLSCEVDTNGKVFSLNTVYKEFGIDKDSARVLFSNLSQESRSLLCIPLTQFILLSKYVIEQMNNSSSVQWAKDNNIDSAFIKSTFINHVKKVAVEYKQWLNEMEDNDRSFSPFNIDVKDENLYSIVRDVKPSTIKGLWAFNKSGYNLFDAAMNKEYSSLSKNLNKEHFFIELAYIVTKELVEKKFKF